MKSTLHIPFLWVISICNVLWFWISRNLVDSQVGSLMVPITWLRYQCIGDFCSFEPLSLIWGPVVLSALSIDHTEYTKSNNCSNHRISWLYNVIPLKFEADCFKMVIFITFSLTIFWPFLCLNLLIVVQWFSLWFVIKHSESLPISPSIPHLIWVISNIALQIVSTLTIRVIMCRRHWLLLWIPVDVELIYVCFIVADF